MEIREPTADEQTPMRELAVLSFNVPRSWVREGIGPTFHPEHFLCAYERGRLVATTRDIPMQQWFGGRPVEAAGIAAVATVPEARGTGVGDRLMRELLQRARDRGAAVASLFPATVPFYRRLGYEYGGLWTSYRARLSDLPRDEGATTIELFEGEDVGELRTCYRTFAQGRTGPVEGDDDWWRDRVLLRWIRDEATRAVVARGRNGVEGYAAFSLQTRGEWEGYDVACTHLVATTPGALRDLLGYLRRYKGVGIKLQWQGLPSEPLALLLEEESIDIRKQFRYMTRVLDTQSALEARGYPEGLSGEAVIDVEDPLFEDNHGGFRIEADHGKVRVERTDAGDALHLSIRALSGLFSGYFTPADLAAAGAIDGGHPAAGFLTALFSGPPPFMLDHF